MGCFYAALIIWYFWQWNKSKSYTVVKYDNPFVSIIIVARNESENIEQCLTSVWDSCRKYGPTEILLVDDHSTDKTIDKAEKLKIPILRLLRLSEYKDLKSYGHSYKKAAIHYALSEATSDIILSTDADCTVTDQWVKSMSELMLNQNVAAVTGPISMKSMSSNILTSFQEVEMIGTMAGSLAGIDSGLYFSANAANMIYYKQDYLEFCKDSKNELASGDDMFFVQWLAINSRKILFAKSKMAIVQTKTMDTIRSFFNQRIRWATKTKSYDLFGIKVLMALVFCFHFNIIAGSFLAAYLSSTLILWAVSLSVIVKLLVDYILLNHLSAFFDVNMKKVQFPLLVGLHTIYIVLIGFAGLFFRSYQWKGRKVH